MYRDIFAFLAISLVILHYIILSMNVIDNLKIVQTSFPDIPSKKNRQSYLQQNIHPQQVLPYKNDGGDRRTG